MLTRPFLLALLSHRMIETEPVANPLWGNTLLQNRANALASLLNSGPYTIHLFQNNFLPTPATPLSSFLECNFTGYTSLSLTGQFGTATKIVDGQWSIQTSVLGWGNTGSTAQTIAGWYVTDGANLIACQLLGSAITINPGDTYTFIFSPQEISQSIL